MAETGRGAIVNLTPNFDATLRDDGFDGTFNSGGNGNFFNTIRRIDGVVNEVLFFEFDVSVVGDSEMVSSATLSLGVFGTPNDPGDIEILAYQADGVLTFPDDGARPSTLVATYDPISEGSGTISISLDAATVDGFIKGGDFIGFRLQGAEDQADTTIQGVVNVFDPGGPPTLTLDISAVPEPTSAVLLMGLVSVVACKRRRR
ncbi:PEP-CTERM sorting domain-containing protein [Stieleria sp. JC731]|nr:PEP-CTERM sorting domain-containing protein [Stieleria sp. JC731]MCC9600269.1 PEP-CTERM sorting domain-containing protein [Stieleria sp. JC731]